MWIVDIEYNGTCPKCDLILNSKFFCPCCQVQYDSKDEGIWRDSEK